MNILKQRQLVNQLHNHIEIALSPKPTMPSAANSWADLFNNNVRQVAAGGMVRDHFFGDVATDLDIFVLVPSLTTQDKEVLDQMMIARFITAEVVDDTTPHNALTDKPEWDIDEISPEENEVTGTYSHNVISVFELTHIETKQKANIILSEANTPSELMATFPCNLSKCYAEPHYDSVFSEDFIHGTNNKILEFNEAYTSEKYLTKIAAKFPNFKIKVV